MSKKWYALAVHPRKEDMVEHQLRARSYKAVCPRYKKLVRHARSTKTIATPLFPGYLFVQLDETRQSWRRVNWVSGSIGLIKFDSRPAPLADSFVEQIVSYLGNDGLIAFKQKLSVGDRIEAVGGPFDRLIGEIIEMSCSDRVKVLIEALNRKVEVSLPKATVVAAA